ncbi:hypothetical protein BC834DRAFT_225126 [Gloeopeniophorella convolvens]|nr:hypothetical protein BC834DRAFT_601780 [Gloeopeniophorella convolvens]KAI0273738.1 hypothetical protein BC834DRAFT_225126 [Gloeopeniophorella convolvens]
MPLPPPSSSPAPHPHPPPHLCLPPCVARPWHMHCCAGGLLPGTSSAKSDQSGADVFTASRKSCAPRSSSQALVRRSRRGAAVGVCRAAHGHRRTAALCAVGVGRRHLNEGESSCGQRALGAQAGDDDLRARNAQCRRLHDMSICGPRALVQHVSAVSTRRN